MKKLKNKISILVLAGIFMMSGFLTSCDDEESKDFWTDVLSDALVAILQGEDISNLFGWEVDEENMDEIESDINLGDEDSNFPGSVDLSNYFPPIGNQGQYGTCVAWSVGYNLRTFLDAKESGRSPNSSSQQFSPKDLFWAIPSSGKGDDCNGANFEPAFDVMVERGIATLSDVPYSNLGDCSDAPQQSWTNSAADNKILKYRKINYDVGTIKSYLSQGRAVAIGAKLGDNFMAWDNDDIISYDTYLNPGMQHAYHAMAVSGYSDSKSAFRVVNSWSDGWGDDGYIWVDYDFFVDDFCFAAFVASVKEQKAPDEVVTDSNYELVAWDVQDKFDTEYDGPRDRVVEYEVYNKGKSTISSSFDWNILYLYYNAYDANEYGILIFDYYSDDYGLRDDKNGVSLSEIDGVPQELMPAPEEWANWYTNIDLKVDESLYYDYQYTVPEELSGYYFFVQIVDGYDVIPESDEENNYFFFTDENDEPLYIQDGEILSNPNVNSSVAKSANGKLNAVANAASKSNPNTYSPDDIRSLINYQKSSGKLKEKIAAYLKSDAYKNQKKKGRRIHSN